MEMTILITLAILAIIGSFLSYYNFLNNRNLSNEIISLKKYIQLLEKKLSQSHVKAPNFTKETSLQERPTKQQDLAEQQAEQTSKKPQEQSDITFAELAQSKKAQFIPTHEQSLVTKVTSTTIDNTIEETPAESETITSSTQSSLEQFIAKNGLLWMGAVVLALGGIFLAKYAIEAGLLPPSVRLTIGFIFGLLLLVAAEYLYRNPSRFDIESPHISAALASGGVITCFAMQYSAYSFYQFISPAVAFLSLAITAFCAIALSLRYSILLAFIGIIGSYAVPIIVSTDSNNISALLAYIALVSMAAIWVSQKLDNIKLWWLSFAANTLWLYAAISLADSNLIAAIFIFLLATLYLFVFSNILGWKLSEHNQEPLSVKTLLMPRKEQLGIIIALSSLCTYFSLYGFSPALIWINVVFATMVVLLCIRHSAFDLWPYVSLILVIFTLAIYPQPNSDPMITHAFMGKYLFTQFAALASLIFGFAMMQYVPNRLPLLVFLVVAPIAIFATSYVLSDQASEILYSVWATELLLLAAVCSGLAIKKQQPTHKLALTLLSNAAISLCLTMLLETGILTLALTIQLTSVAYLSRKMRIDIPDWIYKCGLLIVLIRLSAAPWLASFAEQQILGVHWTAILYPIVFCLFYTINKIQLKKQLKPWFEGALIHIIALFITTETSYLAVGHYPDFNNLTFIESTLLAMNWLILSLSYLWRHHYVKPTHKLYKLAAYALCLMSLILHVDLTLLSNPFFTKQHLGEQVVLNWLLPLWLIPAITILLALRLNLIEQATKKIFWCASGVFLALFVNGNIRIAFQENSIALSQATSQGELYSYSLVWLTIATISIIAAKRLSIYALNQLGFALLFIVVVKAFIFDLSHLTGLYRAISFIGLGLVLVAIGWLFQRLKPHKTAS